MLLQTIDQQLARAPGHARPPAQRGRLPRLRPARPAERVQVRGLPAVREPAEPPALRGHPHARARPGDDPRGAAGDARASSRPAPRPQPPASPRRRAGRRARARPRHGRRRRPGARRRRRPRRPRHLGRAAAATTPAPAAPARSTSTATGGCEPPGPTPASRRPPAYPSAGSWRSPPACSGAARAGFQATRSAGTPPVAFP